MEHITVKELTSWIIQQTGLWDMDDMILTFRRLPSLHHFLNSQTFFELDTVEGDRLVENWMDSERILIHAL